MYPLPPITWIASLALATAASEARRGEAEHRRAEEHAAAGARGREFFGDQGSCQWVVAQPTQELRQVVAQVAGLRRLADEFVPHRALGVLVQLERARRDVTGREFACPFLNFVLFRRQLDHVRTSRLIRLSTSPAGIVLSESITIIAPSPSGTRSTMGSRSEDSQRICACPISCLRGVNVDVGNVVSERLVDPHGDHDYRLFERVLGLGLQVAQEGHRSGSVCRLHGGRQDAFHRVGARGVNGKAAIRTPCQQCGSSPNVGEDQGMLMG